MNTFRSLAAATALLSAAGGVLAQGAGKGAANPSSPAAMVKWREQHRSSIHLRTMTAGGLVEMEKGSQTRVRPEQAKQILEVLTPLRKQPKLTQPQAQEAVRKLEGVFDAEQRAAIGRVVQEEDQRTKMMAALSQGAEAAPQPAPSNNPRRFNANRLKDFNPLNPAPDTPMYERSAERVKRVFAFLEARAAGREARLVIPRLTRPGGKGKAASQPQPKKPAAPPAKSAASAAKPAAQKPGSQAQGQKK